MRHIILLSHEILAYGLLQTARHVLGSVEGCTAYCAYMNPYINDEAASSTEDYGEPTEPVFEND